MSPCCVVLASSAVGSGPLAQVQQFEANSLLLAALAALKEAGCQTEQRAETESGSLFAPLLELSNSPLVAAGSVSELAIYKDWVRSRIQAASELASKSKQWGESGVVQRLQRAIRNGDLHRIVAAWLGFHRTAPCAEATGRAVITGGPEGRRQPPFKSIRLTNYPAR